MPGRGHILRVATKKSGKQKQTRGDAFTAAVCAAAIDELAERGLDRFSVPDVARRVGVNKTSIYRRWPTRDALVVDALRTTLDRVNAPPHTGSLRGDLCALGSAVAAFLASPTGAGVLRVMFADGAAAALRKVARTAWQNEAAAAVSVLEDAIVRGELQDAARASRLLFTLAGAILHRLIVEQQAADDDFVTETVDLLLDGALRPRA